MCSKQYIFPVKSKNDVFCLSGTESMLSQFPQEKNISITSLKSLLAGNAIVDIGDEEYIHWLQLDDSAIEYVKHHVC
ncbi:2-hydroxymuconic semialdehyde hydrolase [Lactiplantibacillus plantarum]|uniref:2-hydroxymuconic semialdehyde hydrolase n=1 Tax=Lactiplantibacillus plantarum TaxID=1590 RepID=UPI0023080D87|nr:2-hydroxymuconic semialdehyde hydrolase [Lactiplantibacillus plantarum]MCG0612551.1 2-hydroxymuconic semialdehyde hydrolase [Lactiplantibacillus plantarum]MCG0618723.1 2-hydroxymuconic semialdehyde hydrolase [Lactiplantibacillus plantarum]MCG0778127.1 2-hydroxymuconic semialdehyde hydrolase [Lactiplantibacillus plantarum]MCG0807127.1 2-hydroxymuconic semialdehyde hydrolase [Lactiplantibacillus plantarum]MCG0832032.1 2-hydroxymuconic semialdehyde hydrolase [Lactiplantibacillus plantarum]